MAAAVIHQQAPLRARGLREGLAGERSCLGWPSRLGNGEFEGGICGQFRSILLGKC